jgi:hypothetical protein
MSSNMKKSLALSSVPSYAVSNSDCLLLLRTVQANGEGQRSVSMTFQTVDSIFSNGVLSEGQLVGSVRHVCALSQVSMRGSPQYH